jgi:hypothetical protein
MAYLRAEIMVIDLEADVALDEEKPIAQIVGSD